MDTTVIVLIAVVVVLVVALAVAGAMLLRRRRSERLQEHFGPEYERSVSEAGNRRAGEAELSEREKRHRKLDIRELDADEREGFTASWARIQRQFVDDPKGAVRDADGLVVEILQTRGYPAADFERRAADISVDHPEVVHRYREAHAVRDATEHGSADTEQERSAVTSYRSLVEVLLDGRRDDRPDRSDETVTSQERSR